MRRATYRSSFAVLNATFLAFLMVAAVRAAAAQNGKPLSQQEVLELLEGGVPSARVSSIVDDRGINFRFTDEIEQKVRDAGGADDVVAALRRASQRRAETEQPRTGGLIIKTTPGETEVYLNDEPKGMTSPEGEIRLPDLQPGSYKLRVSLPGYQSYEEPMPVTAGEEQTVYVTLVQKSATLRAPNNRVPEPPAPSGGISIPGIKIAPLQFFEGPHDLTLEKSQRVYLYNFDHTTARSIYWELDLSFPTPGQRIDFQLDALWYKPDGSELRHQTFSAYVMPTWRNSWHTHGYGWADAGHWPPGIYRVELLFKGVRISSGSFQIN
ncbi:MAG: PEGA domain-containing protein [Terriglobia bacterium]|jgi:hypothetical protein